MIVRITRSKLTVIKSHLIYRFIHYPFILENRDKLLSLYLHVNVFQEILSKKRFKQPLLSRYPHLRAKLSQAKILVKIFTCKGKSWVNMLFF